MLKALSDWFHLARLGAVMIRHDVILPAEYRTRAPLALKWVGTILRIANPKGRNVRSGQTLASELETMGPAWIKLGQLLSTRPDIIGVTAARDLSRLKDRLPPFSQSLADATLKAEFGAQSATLFADLGAPIAAASIAQVHKLETLSGTYAVKILRPGVERMMDRELRALRRLARLASDKGSKTVRRLEPEAFVETMAQSLTNELDLRFEAGAASEFRDIAALDGFVSVPKVDWTRTSRRVLTTEWVDARSLTDPRALDGVNRQDLANRMTRGFLACALDHGFFHADMHEGNIMVSPEGELTLIDFGIMGRIGMNERRFLAEILHGFLQRDYRRVAEVHFEAGYVPANRSLGDFAQALRSVGEPIFGQEASNVSMGRVLIQLLDITEQFGMRLRPELILLQKTMVQVEGVSRSIDPDHNIWTAAQPIVARWTRREFGPEGLARTIKEASLAAVRAVSLLPSLVDRLHPPKLPEEGPKAQKSDLARTRRPSRLVWAIIGAAALWASAHTVQTITLEGAMMRWVSSHLIDPWRAFSD